VTGRLVTLTADDRLQILDLVTRADNAATARDANGYALLFTDDATMSGGMGTAHGRDELREAVAAVWAAEPPGTQHLTVNATIEPDASGARVASVMLMVAPDPMRILGWAAVEQVARRTADGWRIASRAIRPAGG
jgi:uncharacterized protein (TIGR02246 family)